MVKDLAKDGQAYRLSALEITGLAQLAGGDKTKAKATFEALKKAADTEAPNAGFGQRADQMLNRLAD
jgi:hypothetical protein